MNNCLDGTVQAVSESGDLITSITEEDLIDVPKDDSVTVTVDDHPTIGIHSPNHGEPESTMVAVLGDSGYLEIGIVGVNISEMLGIKKGAPVKVTW